MKQYQYKIQWLLDVTTQPETDDALKVIEILGHRSFDKIYFRDINLEIIGSFSTVMYSSSQEETVRKEIEKEILDNNKIAYLELLRK